MIETEPPRWTLEPKDKAVTLGHSLILDAKAEAVPEPIIRWKKSHGTTSFLRCGKSAADAKAAVAVTFF